MTPEQIVAEYLRREAAASATQKGHDPSAIIEDMAHEYEIDTAVLTEIVLDATILGAC